MISNLVKVELYRWVLKNCFVIQLSQDSEVLRIEDTQSYRRTRNWHFSREDPKEVLTNRLVVAFILLISSPGPVPFNPQSSVPSELTQGTIIVIYVHKIWRWECC